MGIEKLECFVFNERDRSLVRDMLDCNYDHPDITGWARANVADIDANLSMEGINEVGILMVHIGHAHFSTTWLERSRTGARQVH